MAWVTANSHYNFTLPSCSDTNFCHEYSYYTTLHSHWKGLYAYCFNVMSTALTKIKPQFWVEVESSLYTLQLFLDIRKAFDSIKHHILEEKLLQHGIHGLWHDLIFNYLSCHSQYVHLHGMRYTVENIYGIPQQPIFGPIPLLHYINNPIISHPHQTLYYMLTIQIRFFSSKNLYWLEVLQ